METLCLSWFVLLEESSGRQGRSRHHVQVEALTVTGKLRRSAGRLDRRPDDWLCPDEVVFLAWPDECRKRSPSPVAGEVEFRAEAATGATERVVARFLR